MNTSVKVPSLKGYAIRTIKLKGTLPENQQQRFFDALAVVGLDPEVAFSVAITPLSADDEQLFLDVAKRIEGSTPHEIIAKAEPVIAEIKRELKARGQQVEGKTMPELLKAASELGIPLDDIVI